jgi:hypothetical protein
MEQLIFVAVIVFFSVIDAIAKSRKAKQGGTAPSLPEGMEDAPWEGQTAGAEDELPAYDHDPSYDEMAVSYDERVGRSSPGPSTPSSETLLPRDFLEELAALAAGGATERQHQERVPTASTQPSSVSIPSPRTSSVRPEQRLPEPAQHVVHQAHRGYGTDPSSRAPSEQDGLDPLAVTLGEDARTVRRRLLSHDAHALRQAIVLQEVLGPPAALRDDQFRD